MKPIPVRSRAEMLRVLKAGCVIRVVAHHQPRLVGTTRTPEKVQGNGYWFRGPRHSDGEIIRMWGDVPKASDLAFGRDGRSVTFHPSAEKSWTLAFEEAS